MFLTGHGTSITLIGHLSKDKTGIDPLTLAVSEDTPIELADEFPVVSFVETLGDISVLHLFKKVADNQLKMHVCTWRRTHG